MATTILKSKPRCLGLLAVALLVTACSSASDISERNSDFVGVTLKEGVLSGTYNPSGFDARLIQNQIKSICVGEDLGAYGEQTNENGLVAFSARCASGTTLTRAFMEIERLPNGNFSVEIIGA
ncbi:MAG: hypothetical protein ABJ251_14050 [Paracoccaceae bacterium]